MLTWSPHERGRKGVQGAKSPAGVWGVPSFSFSPRAAAGGKDSLKSAPMEVSQVTSSLLVRRRKQHKPGTSIVT